MTDNEEELPKFDYEAFERYERLMALWNKWKRRIIWIAIIVFLVYYTIEWYEVFGIDRMLEAMFSWII